MSSFYGSPVRPLTSVKQNLHYMNYLHIPIKLLFYFFQIREEPTPYSSPFRKSYELFENPLAGTESEFNDNDEDQSLSGNIECGTALYDFTAGGNDEVGTLSLISILFNATMWTTA